MPTPVERTTATHRPRIVDRPAAVEFRSRGSRAEKGA
jgi:hypothetical protein